MLLYKEHPSVEALQCEGLDIQPPHVGFHMPQLLQMGSLLGQFLLHLPLGRLKVLGCVVGRDDVALAWLVLLL